MKKAVILALILGTSSQTASAGFYTNTAHSRANCAGFNESVTWNATQSHWWRVESHHIIQDVQYHILKVPMAYTWRAAALHFKEFGSMPSGWRVEGYHFYLNDKGKEIYDVFTVASDCREYDGWYD